jgi:hypothetical protein
MSGVVSEAELRRRARCIAYRLRCGELVVIHGDEPWIEYLSDGMRVPAGCAQGVVPGML